MKSYQYQIIRYIHDHVTGEFVNVGLVCYEPDSSYLRCKVINRIGRISNFFLEVKGHYIIALLRQLESQINLISKDTKENNNNFKSLDIITASVLPKDDSAIICTEVKKAIDIDFDKAFEDLYYRFVEKYIEEPETNPHNDNYAWKNYYKRYFEKYGLIQNFKKHSVKTLTDEINFDKSWKNGVWNCYQSLSLDLSKTESIKNKVYRWSGILRQLETTVEPMHLYFLTVAPKNNLGLTNFIKEALTLKNKQIEVTLVEEKDAEKFAAKVKKKMENSFLISNDAID